MTDGLKQSIEILANAAITSGVSLDRREIVAHATVSAWAHHWPSQVARDTVELLRRTEWIREREPGRWLVQRRIAVAKLSGA